MFTLRLRSTGTSYQGRASSLETFQSTLRNVPGMTQGRNWLSDSQKKGWLSVVTEPALPDLAALGWLLSAASGLSSSKCFFFPLSVVMSAFGKGEIGSDSLKKKRGKKGEWKEEGSGAVWDAASLSKWFVAVESSRECWSRRPLQALLSCHSVLISKVTKYVPNMQICCSWGPVAILTCAEMLL